MTRALALLRAKALLYPLACLLLPTIAYGQEIESPPFTAASATEALQVLLDSNIDPGGPLRGDGATIAGVLAGQSLTFPISSSSGAFVTRSLEGFGPRIPVSTSGSFGPLFAERGFTNGRNQLSVSLNYQHMSWRSLSGLTLGDGELKLRAVYRNQLDNRGPTGTAEEYTADIDFTTDVLVVAANYGITDSLDVGLSVPYVRARVEGVKQRVRIRPQSEPTLLAAQRVTGASEGIGDAIVRVKYRLPLGGPHGLEGGWLPYKGLQTAIGFDVRFPTGKTAELFLDCPRSPCAGAATQEVPDVGLGKLTQKFSVITSAGFGRLSPHINAGYIWVPTYACDQRRFGSGGHCRGSIFEVDTVNGTQDAKNQNLSNEWNVTAGLDYQLVPYKATVSADVIGRQLVRAGQFYLGPPRVIVRDRQRLDDAVSTEVESRHGNVNTLLGAISAKVSVRRRWVLSGTLLFPLNSQGLQPNVSWVLGLERPLGR